MICPKQSFTVVVAALPIKKTRRPPREPALPLTSTSVGVLFLRPPSKLPVVAPLPTPLCPVYARQLETLQDPARLLPQEGWVEDNDIGTRNNHNAAAGFSTWVPGFGDEQLGRRRQQSPRARFRNGVAAVSGSAPALHAHPRRHSVTEGLVGDEAIRAEVAGGGGVGGGGRARAVIGGAVPTDKDNGSSCPPGFSAGVTRGYGNGSNGRRWSETGNGVSQQAQGEERSVEVYFGSNSISMSDHSGGRTWGGASSLMPEGGTAPADDDIVGDLWEGIGAGGLDSQERSSSWPNPLLSPGSGGRSPWCT